MTLEGVTTPPANVALQSGGPGLSVGMRVGILALAPLVGLLAVLAIFWTSARTLDADLGRSRADLETSLLAKSFRDRVNAAELATMAYLQKPSAGNRAAVTAARDAAVTASRAMPDRPAALDEGLTSLSGDLDSILAAQDAAGADEQSGAAGRVAARGDGLEKLLADAVDYSDPLGAATVEVTSKMRRAEFKFALARDVATRDEVLGHTAALAKDVDASFMSADKKTEMADALKTYVADFTAWANAVAALGAAQERAQQDFQHLTAAADEVVLAASASAEATGAALAEAEGRTTTLVAVAIALAVLICAALGLVIGRSVSTPITALASAMHRMTEGDLAVEVPAGRRDEIGRMAEAVLRSARRLEKRRIEQEAEASRTASAAERAARDAEKEAEARSDQNVVALLGDGLRRLSGGDLATRITTPFGKAEQLRIDFNAASEKLQNALASVSRTTVAMRSRTSEISASASALQERTGQQAHKVGETVAALADVTATVGLAARTAEHASAVVSATEAGAREGGGVVREAVEAMDDIETSSRQIGQIIGVIDEIAFQTNLLALNAGVEAARAGEAGRGFAVVASEVRALAQRSAEAAKEIKVLVTSASTSVGRGVDLVGRTGAALERIIGQVKDLAGAVEAIAASAQQQADGLAQANAALSSLEEITSSNVSMVDETMAVTRTLASDADELGESVSRFHPEDGHRFDDVRRALRTVGPTPRPRLWPPSRPASGHAALRLVGSDARDGGGPEGHKDRS